MPATDTSIIPLRFETVIVEKAKYYAFTLRGELQNAQLAQMQFDKSIKRMRVELINKTDIYESRLMPELSQTGAFPFVCEGGLVLNQSTFIMKPGQALELLNFEPDIEGGYRRITGFSKYVTAIVPQTSASTEEVLLVATFGSSVMAAQFRRKDIYCRCRWIKQIWTETRYW